MRACSRAFAFLMLKTWRSATRCVADHHHPPGKQAKADDPDFTVVLPCVLDFKRHASENNPGVIESSSRASSHAFFSSGVAKDLAWGVE